MRLLFLAVKMIALTFGLWAGLVYGLPWARATIPGFCARWKQTTGICGEAAQQQLGKVDTWAQAYLRPLPKDARVQGAVMEAREAVGGVETALRTHVGDTRVDAAVRGAQIALEQLQSIVDKESGAGEKLAAIPENARILLAQAQSAFARLRGLLRTTSRRAEDVSKAVDDTQRALDALSKVLPDVSPSPSQ